MEEIWRDISGYEGRYQVSNLGKIKIIHYKSFNRFQGGDVVIKDKFRITKRHRYCRVTSTRKEEHIEILVHRAVAMAFPEICGKWFKGCVVHHIDGNPLNNKAENLKVLSIEEHQKIHSEDGITYKKVSEKLKGRKLTEEWINKIVLNRRTYEGKENPFFGKHHSKETIDKLKKINTDKHPTLETRKKMAEKHSKKICAYKDGVFVKEFASLKEGAEYYNLRPQNISQVLRGRGKHCGGYEWKYA